MLVSIDFRARSFFLLFFFCGGWVEEGGIGFLINQLIDLAIDYLIGWVIKYNRLL